MDDDVSVRVVNDTSKHRATSSSSGPFARQVDQTILPGFQQAEIENELQQ